MSSSSSTAIEARVMSVPGLPLEDELRRPDGDCVPGAQLGALEAAAVYLGAVGGVEVDHPVRGAFLPDLRVAARHVRVGDLDVAVLRAPDHDAALLDLVLLAVPRECHDLALETQLLRRDRLRDGLLRLVDHRRARRDRG